MVNNSSIRRQIWQLVFLEFVFLGGTYWAMDRALAIASLSTIRAEDPGFDLVVPRINAFTAAFFFGLLMSAIVFVCIIKQINKLVAETQNEKRDSTDDHLD
jgi:hypothetical protein